MRKVRWQAPQTGSGVELEYKGGKDAMEDATIARGQLSSGERGKMPAKASDRGKHGGSAKFG